MKKGSDYPGVSIVYFCHDGAGNYLFQKRGANCRDEHGRWDCGGGALEFDEKVEDCLTKEIREEYGVTPLEAEFLGFRDVHREHGGKKTHWVALDFRVKVNRKEARNAEPHKFDEIGWFSLSHLPSPLHSQLPATLEEHKEKLK
jgi:ADP-ribose pyrophosphatase YjhB (NUDIX family)